ncbi:MAG TPA: cell division protein FtsL, partial [Lysobacter sp.]
MTLRVVLAVLLVANIVSALAVVYARHQHRQLFVQMSRLERARDELNIEFG